MGEPVLEFTEIPDSGDVRGNSFPVPAELFAQTSPFVLRDMHISTIRPGCTRGDHYHSIRHEILVVMPVGKWSLYWDTGSTTRVRHQRFDGTRAVVIRVSPHASHALRNDGDSDLWVIGLCDEAFDPSGTETVPRKVSAR
jgi:dTDP-4-dehydrorhamnose 3,5-epimerase-like enzyme